MFEKFISFIDDLSLFQIFNCLSMNFASFFCLSKPCPLGSNIIKVSKLPSLGAAPAGNYWIPRDTSVRLKGYFCWEKGGAGSGNRTRTLSLEGSYDTISPYPLQTCCVIRAKFSVKHITIAKFLFSDTATLSEKL